VSQARWLLRSETTEGIVGGLFNCEQRACQVFHRMILGRLDRAILTGLGGSASISHLAVLLIFATRNGSLILSMREKDIVRLLRAGFSVPQFCVVSLGLALHSYYARELLVCWLLFCLSFAALTGVILGVVLVCYAGKYIAATVVDMATRVREHPMDFSGTPQETILTTRIANSAVAEVAAARQPSAGALGLELYVFVPAAYRTEVSVQK
jgi:hypothetical protein